MANNAIALGYGDAEASRSSLKTNEYEQLSQTKTYNFTTKSSIKREKEEQNSKVKVIKKPKNERVIKKPKNENFLTNLFGLSKNKYNKVDPNIDEEYDAVNINEFIDKYEKITIDQFIYNKKSTNPPLKSGEKLEFIITGDAMAKGVNSALRKLFLYDKNIRFINFTKNNYRFYNKNKPGLVEDFIIKSQKLNYDTVILMAGYSDYKSYSTTLLANEVDETGKNKFLGEFAKKIDKFVNNITQANKTAYIIGLPITYNPDINQYHAQLNEIIIEKLRSYHSINYINSWDLFSNEEGEFVDIDYDIRGIETILRTTNGILFTNDGYLKLAEYVEQFIRGDYQSPHINEEGIKEVANIKIEENLEIINSETGALSKKAGKNNDRLVIYDIKNNVRTEKITKDTYYNFHQLGVSVESKEGRADDFYME